MPSFPGFVFVFSPEVVHQRHGSFKELNPHFLPSWSSRRCSPNPGCELQLVPGQPTCVGATCVPFTPGLCPASPQRAWSLRPGLPFLPPSPVLPAGSGSGGQGPGASGASSSRLAPGLSAASRVPGAHGVSDEWMMGDGLTGTQPRFADISRSRRLPPDRVPVCPSGRGRPTRRAPRPVVPPMPLGLPRVSEQLPSPAAGAPTAVHGRPPAAATAPLPRGAHA